MTCQYPWRRGEEDAKTRKVGNTAMNVGTNANIVALENGRPNQSPRSINATNPMHLIGKREETETIENLSVAL